MSSSCTDLDLGPGTGWTRSRTGRLLVVVALGAAALIGSPAPATTTALLTDHAVVSIGVPLPQATQAPASAPTTPTSASATPSSATPSPATSAPVDRRTRSLRGVESQVLTGGEVALPAVKGEPRPAD